MIPISILCLCLQVASICTTVYAGSMILFGAAKDAQMHASTPEDTTPKPNLVPMVLYSLLVLGLVVPQAKQSRLGFFTTTCRRVLLPLQLINFADFLLADIFTSLSRPLADMGIAVCALTSMSGR